MKEPESGEGPEQSQSSDPSVSRKQFLELVLKRAGLAGALLIAPKVVDSFLVPPAYAKCTASTGMVCAEDTTGMNNSDTG